MAFIEINTTYPVEKSSGAGITRMVDRTRLQSEYDQLIFPEKSAKKPNTEETILDRLDDLKDSIADNDDKIAKTIAIAGAVLWQAGLTRRTMENAYPRNKKLTWTGLAAETAGVGYLIQKIWAGS